VDERFDYIIAGGGVAGVTAAETIRDHDSGARIGLLSAEAEPLYSRVLLPRYVEGLIPRDRLFLRSEADYAAKKIERFSGAVAHHLDIAERRVFLVSGKEFGFGKLLIAGGGAPKELGIPGERLRGVTHFQTIGDADVIRGAIADARQAVVIGSGFISLEYLGLLAGRGIPTTLLLRSKHLFEKQLDPEAASILTAHFETRGIRVFSGKRVMAFHGSERVLAVETEGGETIPADFVGVGVGLRRSTLWLEGSGIAVSSAGVSVDEHLETAAHGVFAAGDIAVLPDGAGGYRSHGNWANAVLQGRVAGKNIVGDSAEVFSGVPLYSIRCLGLSLAFVGETESQGGVRAVSKVDRGAERLERYFVRANRLIGAVLINAPELPAAAVRLIHGRILLGDAEERLGDAGFDLRSLIG
jgi:NAD(P)H-nitrite reductase large subunit